MSQSSVDMKKISVQVTFVNQAAFTVFQRGMRIWLKDTVTDLYTKACMRLATQSAPKELTLNHDAVQLDMEFFQHIMKFDYFKAQECHRRAIKTMQVTLDNVMYNVKPASMTLGTTSVDGESEVMRQIGNDIMQNQKLRENMLNTLQTVRAYMMEPFRPSLAIELKLDFIITVMKHYRPLGNIVEEGHVKVAVFEDIDIYTVV